MLDSILVVVVVCTYIFFFFLDTTAAESALSWLETHGITMISSADSSMVTTSSLTDSGTTLTLTGTVYNSCYSTYKYFAGLIKSCCHPVTRKSNKTCILAKQNERKLLNSNYLVAIVGSPVYTMCTYISQSFYTHIPFDISHIFTIFVRAIFRSR